MLNILKRSTPDYVHTVPVAVAAGYGFPAGIGGMACYAALLLVRRIRCIMMNILPAVCFAGSRAGSQIIRVAALAGITHGVGRTYDSLKIFAVDPAPQEHDVFGPMRFMAIEAGEDEIFF